MLLLIKYKYHNYGVFAAALVSASSSDNLLTITPGLNSSNGTLKWSSLISNSVV